MVNKIRTEFANMLEDKTIKHISLSNRKYSAYIYRMLEEYGVCFPVESNISIDEKFNMAIFKTSVLDINGEKINMLMLGCKNFGYRNEFAVICADFIQLGELNSHRENILNNPYDWFERWKDLIGNRKTKLMVYDVLGELYSLIYLYKQGFKPLWNSMNMGTHDIEIEDESFEVKSTIKKMDKTVIINSPHQLERDRDKKLSLIFCQFEKSNLGESIEDLKAQLINLGMVPEELDTYLSSKGFVVGKQEYTEKYLLREMSIYEVDDEFPKLTFKDFVDGKLPKGVLYYSYTIELADLKYQKIK